MSALFLWTLVCAVVSDARAASDADRCTACHNAMAFLSKRLEAKREELAPTLKQKEEAIGRVQKAQTKRWLKNEFRVEMMSELEDSMEQLCAQATMTNVRPACLSLRDDREEFLIRAALDGNSTDVICGCAAPAPAFFDRQLRTEAPPKKPVVGGLLRLVGSNYEGAVMEVQDVLVLLHRGQKGGYKRLLSVMSKLATALQNKKSAITLARMDVSKNDQPAAMAVEVDKPTLVLFPRRDKETPRQLFHSAEAEELSAQNQQLQILHHLSTFGSSATTKTANEIIADLQTSTAAATAAASSLAPAPARRKRVAVAASGEHQAEVDGEQCAACFKTLESLNNSLASLQKDLEAKQLQNAKRDAADRVQKAHTKRWLKSEYKVELASGLQDSIEQVCASSGMLELRSACVGLVEAHEDGMLRAVLDGNSSTWFCNSILPGCQPSVLEQQQQQQPEQKQQQQLKSQAVPSQKKLWSHGVMRAVGSTYEATAMANKDVLLLLHRGGDKRMLRILQTVCVKLSKLADKLSCAQMELKFNDPPLPVTLHPQHSTVLLYPADDKAQPRSLPPFDSSEPWQSVRKQLLQMLLTFGRSEAEEASGQLQKGVGFSGDSGQLKRQLREMLADTDTKHKDVEDLFKLKLSDL